MSQSEVAQIRAQIQAEYEAAKQGSQDLPVAPPGMISSAQKQQTSGNATNNWLHFLDQNKPLP